jgi:hypothetical protein
MTEFIRGAWTARTGMPAIGAASLEQALADGTLDTATGACLDFTNSPFGPPGTAGVAPTMHRQLIPWPAEPQYTLDQ